MAARTVYVISDLHLGGDPDDPEVPGGRGFRMCRQGALLARFIEAVAAKDPGADPAELVIAGDFIDFLAERPLGEGEAWAPFHRASWEAVEIFRAVATRREPAVFAALGRLLARGHALTVLLGNHDLELSLPEVRGALEAVLGPGRLRFVYDNEAYVIGDAVIEHGNRADPMNEVDHDALRRVRVLQSRRADDPGAAPFTPPVGSRVVASLMNPLKARYPFIDLLKPESTGMAPILLALEPKAGLKLPKLMGFGALGAARAALNAVLPRFGDEIAGGPAAAPASDPLGDAVRAALPAEDAAALLALASEAGGLGTEIAAQPESWRSQAALRTLRSLVADDRTFDTTAEQGASYRAAAAAHLAAGFGYVVFGHTHRAVLERLPGGVYLNSGTWADLMQVPAALFGDDEAAADEAGARFFADVAAGDLEPWILRRPTYVRLAVGADERVVQADLREFQVADVDAEENVRAR
jgi:UDP-2,3-diacylglucosamine pyrophosphatase LpxH